MTCFRSKRLATQHHVIPIRNNQPFPGYGWIPGSQGVKNGAILWSGAALRGLQLLTYLLSVHFRQLTEMGGRRAHQTPTNTLLWICSSLCFVMRWKNMNFGMLHLKWAWNTLRKLKCHLQTHAPTSGIRRGPANAAPTNISLN